jgi:hypothetical protein
LRQIDDAGDAEDHGEAQRDDGKDAALQHAANDDLDREIHGAGPGRADALS